MNHESKSTISAAIYGAITIISLAFALQMAAKILNLWFFEELPAQGILSDEQNFEKFKLLFALGGICGVSGSVVALLWMPLRKAPAFFGVVLLILLWGAAGGIGFLTFIATASTVGDQNIYTQNYPLFETFLNASIPLCVCLFFLPFFNFTRKPKSEEAFSVPTTISRRKKKSDDLDDF